MILNFNIYFIKRNYIMKYLKTFENFGSMYAHEEAGEGEVFSEICPDCNCNCDECDCTDCECTRCCKTCENVEITNEDNISERKKSKEKKEEKVGLTAKQKKLPQAFQDAILKKMSKSPKKKDEKDGEKKEKRVGLTAGQKKLPEAMQKAILKKQGK